MAQSKISDILITSWFASPWSGPANAHRPAVKERYGSLIQWAKVTVRIQRIMMTRGNFIHVLLCSGYIYLRADPTRCVACADAFPPS